MSRKAFTLIELLVVIAILAALAAILFPVFSKARERARSAVCISNLKQLGTAVHTYLADWDDVYLWGTTAYAAYAQWYPNIPAWYDVLAPYVRNRDVWICPSDMGETHPNDPLGYGERTPPFHAFQYTSYIYPGYGHPGVLLAGRPVHRVKRPSLAPLLLEPRPWHGNYNPKIPLTSRSVNDPALNNLVYCDGHVGQRSRKDWRQDERNAYSP